MEKNIDNLIAVILNESATKAEQSAFDKWLKADKLNQKTFDSIKIYCNPDVKGLKIANHTEIKTSIWKRAHSPKRAKSRSLVPLFYRVAAILVFAFTLTFLFNKLLTTSNSSLTVLKTIEKKNLSGVKSMIYLPDGSIVNLNAESSIVFSEGFKDSIRWVKLKGEAYFTVAKNDQKPFVVQSKNIITTALGTAFNISSFEEDKTVDISLVEGKVEVQPLTKKNLTKGIILEAGEFVSYQNSDVLKTGLFDSKKVLGWKNGVIVFENADYNMVVKKLERWYGIKFDTNGEKPHWNLDAKFENASLEQVLDIISHIEQFNYEIKENTIKLNL